MRMNIVSQRVLALHELLLQIMAEADLATCVSAAGVCQSWYEIAVGEIWRSLPSPVPLFSILAPLVCERGSYGQRFQTTIEPGRWTRFLSLSRHVRTLEYRDDSREFAVHASVFNVISAASSAAAIFPSLRHLDLAINNAASCPEIGAVFLAPTVNCLVFNYAYQNPSRPQTDPEHLLDFFRLVAWKCEVESLSMIHLFLAAPPLGLINLLQKFDRLTSLAFDATPDVVGDILERIRHFPKLTQLGFGVSRTRRQQMGPISVNANAPNQVFGSVSTLQLIDFNVPDLEAIIRPYDWSRLGTLVLAYVGDEAALQDDRFFSIVANACRSLEVLELEIDPPETRSTIPLTFSAFEHIVNSLQLREIRVVHPLPLVLSYSDLVKMASAWGPSIESLHLNPNPDMTLGGSNSNPPPAVGRNQGPLNLTALIPFAQHCQKLHTLGLYIQAISPPSVTGTEIPRFSSCLRSIRFGSSPIYGADPITTFIKTIADPWRGRRITWTQNKELWRAVERKLDEVVD